jgi:methyl-accepting chemotaxis protein
MQTVLSQVDDETIRTPQQARAALAPYNDSIRDLTELATSTSHRKMASTQKAEQDLAQITSFFKTLILVVTLVAVGGAALWSYRMVTDLTRPIAALQEGARKFAEGDIYARVDLARDDELGQLATAFNQMVARVRQRTQSFIRQPPPVPPLGQEPAPEKS